MSCQLNNTHENLGTDYQKFINRITVIWHEMHDFIMTFTLGLLLFSALVNNFTIHFPIKTRRVCRMFYFTTDLMQPVCKFYTPSTRWLIRGNGPMNQSSLLAMYLSSLLLVWLHKFILYVTKLAVVKVLWTKYFFRHMTWGWLTPLKNQLTWRASFEWCVF